MDSKRVFILENLTRFTNETVFFVLSDFSLISPKELNKWHIEFSYTFKNVIIPKD